MREAVSQPCVMNADLLALAGFAFSDRQRVFFQQTLKELIQGPVGTRLQNEK
jgi:hypothetical protein